MPDALEEAFMSRLTSTRATRGQNSVAARRTIVVAVVLALAPLALLTAQERLGGADRDEWQRVSAVFAALGAKAGARIADVGAGGGYFTDRLSETLGPEGRVYAVDISERALMRLHEWRERQERGNVEIILGEVDDPRLPYRSLDGALIVNAYHEMGEYEAMLAGIKQALRIGGRLVIVDNPASASESRTEQTEGHAIAIGLVEADLERAGFRIVDRQPAFIARNHGDHTHRHWMLVAERLRVTVPPPAGLELDPAVNVDVADFRCGFPGTVEELRARRSPPDSLDAAVGGGRLKVCYSRPSARGRVIMGELVPFGEPWRTGANEPTLIHLGFPARIAGVRLEPGTYSLHTIPGPEAWEVVINRSVHHDGIPIDESVRALDVGAGQVSVQQLDRHVESLTFDVLRTGARSAELLLEWETTRVRIPVERLGGS